MAIANTPSEALMLTSLWIGSMILIFIMGVILENKRMKKRFKEEHDTEDN